MDNPALTLGLAMALGMLSQVAALHVRLPGIVILLAAGILFGPDGFNWIRPSSLGNTYKYYFGFISLKKFSLLNPSGEQYPPHVLFLLTNPRFEIPVTFLVPCIVQ